LDTTEQIRAPHQAIALQLSCSCPTTLMQSTRQHSLGTLSYRTSACAKNICSWSPCLPEFFVCRPVSCSAPVERIFSHSGLLMRPNKAKMSDPVLEHLVFLKCNAEHLLI